MNIIRWEPFREMTTLRRAMDKLFEDSSAWPSHLGPELIIDRLPVDMYQTEDNVVVKAALPGVNSEEVDISITGDILTIRGEHKEEEEIKQENYLRKESRYGTFRRSLALPAKIESDKAEAVFENGVLTLTIPKSEQVKPKKIKVRAKGDIKGKK